MRILPLVSILAILLAAGQADAALKLTPKKITAKSKTYDISVAWPQTGVKAIDDDLAAWAKKTADEFRVDSNEDRQPDEPAYFIEVTYKVERNDDQVFAVLFDEYTDMGGAHPNHDYATANYLMPDGWRVYLPELLDGSRGAKRIAGLARADLDRRITKGDDALSDPETVAMGTTPDWDNFRSFILKPDAIALYFPPYQVASYASGPQQSRIPLAALRDVMRADVRKPAASFDCAAARTATEHALCSDVTLARLDRDVAQAYTTHMRNNALAPNTANATALKTDQRAWLARRDAACATANRDCLAKLYRDRAAWLAKQP